MKLEISRQNLEECLNIRFQENPSGESDVVPRGWMDGQTDDQADRHYKANSRFSQFCERAHKTSGTFSFQSLLKRAEHKPAHLEPRIKSNDKFAWKKISYIIYFRYMFYLSTIVSSKNWESFALQANIIFISLHMFNLPSFSAEYARFVKLVIPTLCD